MKIEPDFKLSFEWPDVDAFYDEEEGVYAREEHLEALQESIPTEASYVGYLTGETDGYCTTWVFEDYFYLMPLEDGWDYGLFRITWDDNWGRFGIETCNRVKDCLDQQEAEQALLESLFQSWNSFQEEDPEEGPLHAFLRDR